MITARVRNTKDDRSKTALLINRERQVTAMFMILSILRTAQFAGDPMSSGSAIMTKIETAIMTMAIIVENICRSRIGSAPTASGVPSCIGDLSG